MSPSQSSHACQLCYRHLYGQSKLCNIFLSDHLSSLHPRRLVAVSVHPGAIHTELGRHLVTPGVKSFLELFMHLVTFPAAMGAWNSLWAGVSAAPEEVDRKVGCKGGAMGCRR